LRTKALLVVLLAAGCTRSDAPSIDSLVAPFLGPDYGGVAVGVIHDDSVVVRHGFGPADREHDVPVTPGTVFDLASLSKQFTGAALLLLAQRGQLAMEDHVRKYVPEVPVFDAARPIRLVDLSRHRSGLSEYPRGDSVPTEADVLAWLAQQTTLKFPTDTRWDYVNLNYFVLARVVERVSGMTLSQFLTQNIFAPAGMKTAQVLDRPDADIAGRAIGYCFGKPCRADDGLTGPGGVFASLDDMIAWDRSLARGTPVDLEAMVAAAEPGYALGWRVVTHDGHRAIEHDGDAIGTRTYLVHYLDRPLTVIILSNQTRFEAEKLEQVLAERFGH
jgi:CubicO group peptidase (beta-lactamase class C family)